MAGQTTTTQTFRSRAVKWLSALDSMADLDRQNEYFGTDPEFAKFVVEAGSLFVEGSGTNMLIEKIG